MQQVFFLILGNLFILLLNAYTFEQHLIGITFSIKTPFVIQFNIRQSEGVKEFQC